MKEVQKINEWRDVKTREIVNVEVIFNDGSRVTYKANKIEKEGSIWKGGFAHV